MLAVRHETLGYVSQFLRVVPRVAALDRGCGGADRRAACRRSTARIEAPALLLRLNIPRRLHALPPATFSGGEQQRVNLARGFIGGHPILLLDEPTASLDAENRQSSSTMINEAKARGIAIIAICHDTDGPRRHRRPAVPTHAAAGRRMTGETVLTNARLVLPDRGAARNPGDA